MTKSRIRAASFTGSHGENIVDAPTISLVSPGSNLVYTGFKSVDEAIEHKLLNNLGSEWRIRDRRSLDTPVRGIDKPRDPRDPMLVLASMIRDHALPILEHFKSHARGSLSVDRPLVEFACSVLEEVRLCSDRDFGVWHAVRGDTLVQGKFVSSCWLEDNNGNILDPYTKSKSCLGRVCWVSKMDRRNQARYARFMPVTPDHFNPALGCLRGVADIPEYAMDRHQVYEQARTLRSHAHALLEASRLPVHSRVRRTLQSA